MKIGILYICLGRYALFWKDFYLSCEKYFIPEAEKHYFVYTDSDSLLGADRPQVHIHPVEKKGWPFDTLFRFDIFLETENELKKMDYLYFFNANMRFVKNIGNEFLPDANDELVVTLHPGFFRKKRIDYPYEKHPESLAFIPDNEGLIYVCGGLNGGNCKKYLEMIKELSRRIQEDLSKNIIAKIHDESHLNKYILDKKVKILHPGYIYPEETKLPFEKIIVLLDKRFWGGHAFLRGVTDKPSTIKYWIALWKQFRKVFR
ncbi:MAG: hypothetical protein LBB85_08190 [Dysgonamonadaceae bacterium]|jgi:hypothetical protein|nr:hypothetical protein [Dysgonamonadaceae bacterium]